MYSDGVFEDDPVNYSTHMATLALSMSQASYTHVNNGSYADGARNIKSLLENAGFTDIYVSDSYLKAPTEDSIACVISSKTVHTADGDKKVIAIVVRSGGYDCYYSEGFVQKSVDKLPKDIPVSIALGQVVNKNIKSATVKIYGKTVGGINKHGEYEVSEEKLLNEVTLTENGSTNTIIPAGILPESVRIAISYEDGDSRPLGNGGELTGEYLIKQARVTAPDVSYAYISDIEIGFGYHDRREANFGMISMGFKNTSAGSFGIFKILQKG